MDLAAVAIVLCAAINIVLAWQARRYSEKGDRAFRAALEARQENIDMLAMHHARLVQAARTRDGVEAMTTED